MNNMTFVMNLTMSQMQPDHHNHIGFRREELVLGKSQDQAFQDLVGHSDSSLPENQSQIEAGRLDTTAARHVFEKSGLQTNKVLKCHGSGSKMDQLTLQKWSIWSRTGISIRFSLPLML